MTTQQGIKPLVLTMGEPAGIGPELITRLWQDREPLNLPCFAYIGCPKALQAVASDLPLTIIDDLSEAQTAFRSALPVYQVETAADVIPGTPNPLNGKATIDAIDTAVQFVTSGNASAIVTAPINKEVLYSAGFTAPGHTEYLARQANLPDTHSVMMLTASGVRVVPVTIHIPLKDVARSLTADKIIHAGLVLHHDLQLRFGIKNPRIAVAGLNPHAGEGGTIGIEEATHIMPAIWALRDEGIHVSDPHPADTLFHEEAREQYDAVLCMYHDQALIPIKTIDFWGGVNVTLGLPFIRTSPDHGTALPLAGKGKARADSMLAAIRMAASMAARQTQ